MYELTFDHDFNVSTSSTPISVPSGTYVGPVSSDCAYFLSIMAAASSRLIVLFCAWLCFRLFRSYHAYFGPAETFVRAMLVFFVAIFVLSGQACAAIPHPNNYDVRVAGSDEYWNATAFYHQYYSEDCTWDVEDSFVDEETNRTFTQYVVEPLKCLKLLENDTIRSNYSASRVYEYCVTHGEVPIVCFFRVFKLYKAGDLLFHDFRNWVRYYDVFLTISIGLLCVLFLVYYAYNADNYATFEPVMLLLYFTGISSPTVTIVLAFSYLRPAGESLRRIVRLVVFAKLILSVVLYVLVTIQFFVPERYVQDLLPVVFELTLGLLVIVGCVKHVRNLKIVAVAAIAVMVLFLEAQSPGVYPFVLVGVTICLISFFLDEPQTLTYVRVPESKGMNEANVRRVEVSKQIHSTLVPWALSCVKNGSLEPYLPLTNWFVSYQKQKEYESKMPDSVLIPLKKMENVAEVLYDGKPLQHCFKVANVLVTTNHSITDEHSRFNIRFNGVITPFKVKWQDNERDICVLHDTTQSTRNPIVGFTPMLLSDGQYPTTSAGWFEENGKREFKITSGVAWIYKNQLRHTLSTLVGCCGMPIIVTDKVVGVHHIGNKNSNRAIMFDAELIKLLTSNETVSFPVEQQVESKTGVKESDKEKNNSDSEEPYWDRVDEFADRFMEDTRRWLDDPRDYNSELSKYMELQQARLLDDGQDEISSAYYISSVRDFAKQLDHKYGKGKIDRSKYWSDYNQSTKGKGAKRAGGKMSGRYESIFYQLTNAINQRIKASPNRTRLESSDEMNPIVQKLLLEVAELKMKLNLPNSARRFEDNANNLTVPSDVLEVPVEEKARRYEAMLVRRRRNNLRRRERNLRKAQQTDKGKEKDPVPSSSSSPKN